MIKMKFRILFLSFIVNALFINVSFAQLGFDNVSANLGTIRTTYSESSPYSDYQYSLYPEFQAGGRFFTSFFRWAAYWGYWTDGIDHALPVADMVTYSSKSHIVGFRLAFFPADMAPEWTLPIGIFAGIAHHFVSIHYIGGFGIDGKPGHDFSEYLNTFELGLNTDFSIIGPLGMRAEIHQFFPTAGKQIDKAQKGRRAYKVGLALQF